MNYQESLTVITLIFLLVAAVNLVKYRKRYQSVNKKITILEEERTLLSQQCRDLKTQISENASFATDLSTAEITTKLQTSRMNYHSNRLSGNMPERYGYINALLENGMDHEKIATLLSISVHEAEQLVKLSQLSNR